LIINNLMD